LRNSGKGGVENGGIQRLHKKAMAAIHGSPAMLRFFSSFIYLGFGAFSNAWQAQGALPIAILNGINNRLVQIQLHHFVLVIEVK
jgi:hypothetical protein